MNAIDSCPLNLTSFHAPRQWLAFLAGLSVWLNASNLPAASLLQFDPGDTQRRITEGETLSLRVNLHPALADVPEAGFRVATVTISGGTATAGQDALFENGAASHPVNITPGQSYVTLNLHVPYDGQVEPEETLILTLSDPAPGVTLSGRSNITVASQDAPLLVHWGEDPNPWWSWPMSTWPWPYSPPLTELLVHRFGDTNVAFTVDYLTTTNGTAVPGVDYTPLAGTLAFAQGERTKVVPLVTSGEDGVVNFFNPRFFDVILTNATAGASIASRLERFPVELWDAQMPANLDYSYTPPEVDGIQAFVSGPDGRRLLTTHTELIWLDANGNIEHRQSFPQRSDHDLWVLAFQDNGQALVATSRYREQTGGYTDGRLTRFDAGGRPDPTFSSPLFANGIHAIHSLSDGRILIGTVRYSSSGRAYQLHRLNANGSSDPTFQPSATPTLRTLLTETSKGRILVWERLMSYAWRAEGGEWRGSDSIATGDGRLELNLMELESDGSVGRTLRPAFANEGDGGPVVYQILAQPDGKLVVSGRFTAVNGVPRFNLVRLNTDGSTDESFAYGPQPLHHDPVWQSESRFSQFDGKIWILHPTMGVERLAMDGTPDGRFPVRVPSDNGWPVWISPQAGKLLVVGSFDAINGAPHRRIARILLDHPPQTGAAFVRPYQGSDVRFFNHHREIVVSPKIGSVSELRTIPVRRGGMSPFIYGIGNDRVEIPIRRLGDVRGAAVVEYVTRDGSARAWIDYQPTDGVLHFAPFETQKSFVVRLRQNREMIGTSFQVVLSPIAGVESVEPAATVLLSGGLQILRQPDEEDPDRFIIRYVAVPEQSPWLEISTDLRAWTGIYPDTSLPRGSGRHFFRLAWQEDSFW